MKKITAIFKKCLKIQFLGPRILVKNDNFPKKFFAQFSNHSGIRSRNRNSSTVGSARNADFFRLKKKMVQNYKKIHQNCQYGVFLMAGKKDLDKNEYSN